MKYEFPKINHLNDVLPAIKDVPEFIVVEKDDYIVVNYVVMNEDTFPATGDKFCPGCSRFNSEIIAEGCGSQRCPDSVDVASIRRECRGLIFDKNGSLINRRFHKFFNVNEREETRQEAIDWNQPHHILEKLDGSMVSPCLLPSGVIRWMTKMGITDTSMEAEVFVALNKKYQDFAIRAIGDGFTPIFEWCSNKNRIVLEFPFDQLILTAARDNVSGHYTKYDHLCKIAYRYDIPVVNAYSYDSKNIIDIVRHQEDTEGVVIRFHDGHMVKVKSDWYVRIHKVKALLGQERDVVSMILNNQLDDILPVLPKEDIEKIEQFKIKLMKQLKIVSNILSSFVYQYRSNSDRKSFAIEVAPKMKPMWRGMIFQFWDKECNESLTYKAIIDIVLKHCGSNQSYAKIKNEFLDGVDL